MLIDIPDGPVDTDKKRDAKAAEKEEKKDDEFDDDDDEEVKDDGACANKSKKKKDSSGKGKKITISLMLAKVYDPEKVDP